MPPKQQFAGCCGMEGEGVLGGLTVVVDQLCFMTPDALETGSTRPTILPRCSAQSLRMFSLDAPGCVINRGVVLVDLQQWKAQNITGIIEELVRIHLTKGAAASAQSNVRPPTDQRHQSPMSPRTSTVKPMNLLQCCFYNEYLNLLSIEQPSMSHTNFHCCFWML